MRQQCTEASGAILEHMHHETHSRSVAKGITWRVIASLTTMGLVYAFTGDLMIMAEVGALEITAKIVFYYLHERAWGKVAWGRVALSTVTVR